MNAPSPETLAVARPLPFWASPARLLLIIFGGGVLGYLLIPVTGKDWSLASGVALTHVLIVALARARAEWTRSLSRSVRAAGRSGQLRLTPLLFCFCYTAQRLIDLIR
jgi:hypothetical protein